MKRKKKTAKRELGKRKKKGLKTGAIRRSKKRKNKEVPGSFCILFLFFLFQPKYERLKFECSSPLIFLHPHTYKSFLCAGLLFFPFQVALCIKTTPYSNFQANFFFFKIKYYSNNKNKLWSLKFDGRKGIN